MRAPPPAPRFHLMTLSATGLEPTGDTGKALYSFGLEPEDWDDAPVRARLNSPKRLLVREPPTGLDLAQALAERAFELGGHSNRVLVFCNSRRVAQQVGELLTKMVGAGKRHVELLVGARRGGETEGGQGAD